MGEAGPAVADRRASIQVGAMLPACDDVFGDDGTGKMVPVEMAELFKVTTQRAPPSSLLCYAVYTQARAGPPTLIRRGLDSSWP